MKTFVLVMALVSFGAGCEASAPSMRLESATAVEGGNVTATFEPAVQGRSAEQFWLQLAPAEAPDSLKEGRRYVDRGTKSLTLHADTPGPFEVRLHGAFPGQTEKILARYPVTVFPASHPLASAEHPALPAGRETHATVATD